MIDGTPLYYRGRRILDAMVDDLIPRGILNATVSRQGVCLFSGCWCGLAEGCLICAHACCCVHWVQDVVVGGGSAGALGVYLNVDHYRSRLDPERRMAFSALPDGGWFMDLNNKGYHDGMAWIASPGGMNAVLHPACEEAHRNSTAALCMFAAHVAPFVDTPIFALQAKFDAWQIPNILGSEDVGSINAFGANMTALLESNLLDRPHNGAFVDGCRHHCGGWDAMYIVDGMTEAEAFDRWYTRGSAALPREGRMIDGSRYPCAACTCSFEQE